MVVRDLMNNQAVEDNEETSVYFSVGPYSCSVNKREKSYWVEGLHLPEGEQSDPASLLLLFSLVDKWAKERNHTLYLSVSPGSKMGSVVEKYGFMLFTTVYKKGLL